MKRKRLSKPGDEQRMELTPMIDVTFLLLLFFLCTLQFKTLEGKLQAFLPKDAGAACGETHKDFVQVGVRVHSEGLRVHASGPSQGQPWSVGPTRFEYEGRTLIYSLGPRKTSSLDELGTWLKTFHRQDPDRQYSIESGSKAIYGDIVPVVDALVTIGVGDLRFARGR